MHSVVSAVCLKTCLKYTRLRGNWLFWIVMIYKATGEFLTHQTQEELFYVGMLETDPKGFFTDQCFGNKFRFSTMRDCVILVQTICKQAVKSPIGLRTNVLKFGITAIAILAFWRWSDNIWKEGLSWGGYWLYLMRTEDTLWQWQ